MSRADAKMTLALLASLALSTLTLLATRRDATPATPPSAASAAAAAQLRDAMGAVVPARHYVRIASNSLLADRLLLELAEPERIVGLSRYGFAGSVVRHRYGARTPIDPDGDVEALLALHPDLLLVNNFSDRRRIERLRDAGVVVFELGAMRGVSSLLAQIEQTAALLGVRERGAALAHDFAAHMRAIAADVPAAMRKRGLYVAVHGAQLFGGTRGTSYHDELTYAGLVDAAAERYVDWPAYTTEDLLVLAPEVLVTARGGRDLLCQNAALTKLPACTPAGQVVELDPDLLVDPGLVMLDVTLQIREAVYGPLK